MKAEKLLYTGIGAGIVIRYGWELLGLGANNLIIVPVYLAVLCLLFYYYLQMSDPYYKVCILFFMANLVGIFLRAMDLGLGAPILFIGGMGFFIFPAYMIYHKRKEIQTSRFKYILIFSALIFAQNIMYLLISTNRLLTIGHFLSFPIILSAGHLVYGLTGKNEVTLDERKLLSYIMLLNALSLLGVTFKESFYTFIRI